MKSRITALEGEIKGQLLTHAPLPSLALLVGPPGSGKTTRVVAAGLALTGEAPELALVEGSRDPGRLTALLDGGEPGRAWARATVGDEASTWELNLAPGARAGTVSISGPRFSARDLFPVARLLELLARPGEAVRQELIAWFGFDLEVPGWLAEAREAAEAEGAPSMGGLSAPALLTALQRRAAGAEDVPDTTPAEPSTALQTILDELDTPHSPEFQALVDGASTEEGEERAPTLEGLFARVRLQAHLEGRAEGLSMADAAAAQYVATGASVEGLGAGLVAGLTVVRAQRRAAELSAGWTRWVCEAAIAARRSAAPERVAEEAWEQIRANCGDDALAAELILMGQRLMEMPTPPAVLPVQPGAAADRDYQALFREYEAVTARAERAESDLAEAMRRPRVDTSELAALQGQVRDLQERLAYAERLVGVRDGDIEAIAKELTYTQQAHSETAARLVEAQEQVRALEAQVDSLTTALRTTNRDHDALFAQFSEAQQARTLAEEAERELRKVHAQVLDTLLGEKSRREAVVAQALITLNNLSCNLREISNEHP